MYFRTFVCELANVENQAFFASTIAVAEFFDRYLVCQQSAIKYEVVLSQASRSQFVAVKASKNFIEFSKGSSDKIYLFARLKVDLQNWDGLGAAAAPVQLMLRAGAGRRLRTHIHVTEIGIEIPKTPKIPKVPKIHVLCSTQMYFRERKFL